MLRGDVKAWLQSAGWKFDVKSKRWVKGDLVLWVESSMIHSDRLTWLLASKKLQLDSGSGVIETLYETLNRFD